MRRHEVLIVGGGPAGSALATYLAKRGVDAAVIERETYPRFHIGESLLPHSMDVLRELGVYDRLDNGEFIRKFGAQFVHHQEEGELYFDFVDGIDREHPMAFEVPRGPFDKVLLDNAARSGATIYQPEKVSGVELLDDKVVVTTDRETYEGSFLADATGRDALLGKQFKQRFPNLDLNNIGVFTHFTGVERFEGIRAGDITIGMLPGGKWCWVIPFQGERTSVGVVCPAKQMRAETGAGASHPALETYMREAIAECPPLAARFRHAERVQEVGVISNYSHYCESMVGARWILVGDAASFLDPIFSSGVHMALNMGREASRVLTHALDAKGTLLDGDLRSGYESFVKTGTRRFHAFIRMFYDTNFVRDMRRSHGLKNLKSSFTSVVAGDVWNENNVLFRTGVLA